MTADRREYSRKPGFPDLSVPPPMGYPEPFIPQPEYGFNPEPEPFYGGGYEPTQDSQWSEYIFKHFCDIFIILFFFFSGRSRKSQLATFRD